MYVFCTLVPRTGSWLNLAFLVRRMMTEFLPIVAPTPLRIESSLWLRGQYVVVQGTPVATYFLINVILNIIACLSSFSRQIDGSP